MVKIQVSNISIIIILSLVLIFSGCTFQGANDSKNNRGAQTSYETSEKSPTEEPYTDVVCESKDYVYAIENQKVSMEGNRLKLEYDFVNRDNERFFFKGGATWIINNEVVYFNDYNPEICCDYEVYPGSTVTVTKYFENPSTQQTGRSNVVVPKKQVCEEVTRYRLTVRDNS